MIRAWESFLGWGGCAQNYGWGHRQRSLQYKTSTAAALDFVMRLQSIDIQTLAIYSSMCRWLLDDDYIWWASWDGMENSYVTWDHKQTIQFSGRFSGSQFPANFCVWSCWFLLVFWWCQILNIFFIVSCHVRVYTPKWKEHSSQTPQSKQLSRLRQREWMEQACCLFKAVMWMWRFTVWQNLFFYLAPRVLRARRNVWKSA